MRDILNLFNWEKVAETELPESGYLYVIASIEYNGMQ